MKALKFIINGEEQKIAQELHPICTIGVSTDGNGTIEEGKYVDGAIVILDGHGREITLEYGILDVTVSGESRTLQVFPEQNDELVFDGLVTGLLKLNKSQYEGVDDILFHWEGGEWQAGPS